MWSSCCPNRSPGTFNFWDFPLTNNTVSLQWMTATQVQVAAHLVPFLLSTVTRLSPFPVSRALPRAVEYYGDSVALSLAAGRRSRLDPRETYRACRCSFRSLEPTRCRSLAAESLRQSSVPTDSYGVVAPDVLRQVEECTAGNWGSTTTGFTMRTGRGASCVLHIFGRLRCRIGRQRGTGFHQPFSNGPPPNTGCTISMH
jgi:hypothetical protein